MGFKAGKTIIGKLPKDKVDPYRGLPSFSDDDFSYLFNKLQNMEFKGAEMEKIYTLTLKLQELYVFYNDKKLKKWVIGTFLD